MLCNIFILLHLWHGVVSECKCGSKYIAKDGTEEYDEGITQKCVINPGDQYQPISASTDLNTCRNRY